jgi:hypothetical protein
MNDKQYEPDDPEPGVEQRQVIEALRIDQLLAIDQALLASTDHHWRKLAFVVATAMTRDDHVIGVPDVFYAERTRLLVEQGELEARGWLSRMRYCEIRRPSRCSAASEVSGSPRSRG